MKIFVKQYPGRVAVYFGIALTSAVLETGIAFILAALANSVIGVNDYAPMWFAIFGLLYLVPLGLFDWLRAVTVTRLQTRFTADLRNEILESSMESSLPRDRMIVETGEGLQGALINDSEMVGEDYAYSIFSMLYQAILLTAGLVGTAIINPIFVPIALVLSILGILLPRFAEKPLQRVQRRVADANNAYLDRVALVSSGLESLLSIRRTQRVKHVVGGAVADLESAENSRFATRNLVWMLTWVFGMVIIIGVWGVGAELATRGVITIGGIVGLAQLMTQVAGPLQSMAEQYSRIIAGREQYRDLKRRMSPTPCAPEGPSPTSTTRRGPEGVSARAEMAATDFSTPAENEGVSAGAEMAATDFSTPAENEGVSAGAEMALCEFSVRANDHVLLDGVSFSVPRGARVLVSGPSGAGKSSLFRGLAGLQEASGSLSLNGRPVAPDTAREGHVRLVTQTPVVIPGTLVENIDPDMTGAEAELARPGAHDVLGPLVTAVHNRPDLPVSKLSGGETRRVHVATGLATSGEVLLLDEITTGLDAPAADKVLRAALNSERDYILAVAHDLPCPPADLGFTHVLEIRDGKAIGLSEISQ